MVDLLYYVDLLELADLLDLFNLLDLVNFCEKYLEDRKGIGHHVDKI